MIFYVQIKEDNEEKCLKPQNVLKRHLVYVRNLKNTFSILFQGEKGEDCDVKFIFQYLGS